MNGGYIPICPQMMYKSNDETEAMRKLAEAHGYDVGNDQYTAPRPLPCVQVGRKAIKNCTDKEHFAKIDEEVNELKEAVILYSSSDYGNLERIADEAADTITAITTMLEALGIDAEMRDEAQRRVNAKNRERGRL